MRILRQEQKAKWVKDLGFTVRGVRNTDDEFIITVQQSEFSKEDVGKLLVDEDFIGIRMRMWFRYSEIVFKG